MSNFNNSVLKHILQEYKFDIPGYKWEEKESVLFELKAKFGDLFDREEAEKIYDEMQELPKKKEND